MITYWWFVVSNPKFVTAPYRHPCTFVVVREAGRIGPNDISAEVVASANDRYPLGHLERRCVLRMQECVLKDGRWRDCSTGLDVTPEALAQVVRPTDDPDRNGLYPKYTVAHTATGQPVPGPSFVLLPEKDPAALGALKTYAAMCSEPRLKSQLQELIRSVEQKFVPLWRQGKGLGSLGKINAGFEKT